MPADETQPSETRPHAASGHPAPASYYLVAGVDLKTEMDRLCRLPVFGGEAGLLGSAHRR